MGLIKIKKGLDLPISGSPDQSQIENKQVKKVAILGDDYVGMKPTLSVEIGDIVKKGQKLFADKKTEGVIYTAPAAGKVIEINRGERRAFKSLVIEIQGTDEITFDSYSEDQLKSLDEEKVKKQLIESGLWTNIRVRPFSKVADPATKPHSIFINAIDTNPLAPDVSNLVEGKEKEIAAGLEVVSKLTEGKIFFCKSNKEQFVLPNNNKLEVNEFEGPHPAGLPGTHIHFLDPVSRKKSVWYINVEHLAVIGNLFLTGKIDNTKIISIAGPSVKKPRLIQTLDGASIEELIEDELIVGKHRPISGSVLSGILGVSITGFVGRFHRQISVVPEETEREFLAWAMPAANRYSFKNVVLSKLLPGKKAIFTTSQHGGKRAIVPIGSYEKVMPLDILPTYLLRSISINDVEEAELLGCLELDEEDLALCTFVCPSKNEYGPLLRNTLTLIEKEG